MKASPRCGRQKVCLDTDGHHFGNCVNIRTTNIHLSFTASQFCCD